MCWTHDSIRLSFRRISFYYLYYTLLPFSSISSLLVCVSQEAGRRPRSQIRLDVSLCGTLVDTLHLDNFADSSSLLQMIHMGYPKIHFLEVHFDEYCGVGIS